MDLSTGSTGTVGNWDANKMSFWAYSTCYICKQNDEWLADFNVRTETVMLLERKDDGKG